MNKKNQQRAMALQNKIIDGVKLQTAAYIGLVESTQQSLKNAMRQYRRPYAEVNRIYSEALDKAKKYKNAALQIAKQLIEDEKKTLPTHKPATSTEDLIALMAFKDRVSFSTNQALAQMAETEELTQEQVFAIKAEIASRMKAAADDKTREELNSIQAGIQYEQPGEYLKGFEDVITLSTVGNDFPYLQGATALRTTTMQQDLGSDIVGAAYVLEQNMDAKDKREDVSNAYYNE